jgi:hypothetical protein
MRPHAASKALEAVLKPPEFMAPSYLSGTLKWPNGRKIKERTSSDDSCFHEEIWCHPNFKIEGIENIHLST